MNNLSDKLPAQDRGEIAETVRLLNVVIGQIGLLMQDGDDAVATLDSAFASAASGVAGILEAATVLSGDPPGDSENVGIATLCSETQTSINASIIALQFYDRLSQRLTHVRDTLESMTDLLHDRPNTVAPDEWQSLQSMIRGRYTMREEQVLFDALLDGASVESALRAALVEEKKTDDGIELF